MSLAQKVERPTGTKYEVMGAGPSSKAATPIDFRQIARRVTATPQPVTATPGPQQAPDSAGRMASDVALDLLNEVSSALPALMARCQGLETALADTKEQARVDLETANDVAREWQQIAQTLKVQMEQMERDLMTFKQRADLAETEATSVRTQAERSQQAAAEAECLSSLFQDKVISSFGIGSPGHSILESVRNRTQQMLQS